jgi:hypothetical protein
MINWCYLGVQLGTIYYHVLNNNYMVQLRGRIFVSMLNLIMTQTDVGFKVNTLAVPLFEPPNFQFVGRHSPNSALPAFFCWDTL